MGALAVVAFGLLVFTAYLVARPFLLPVPAAAGDRGPDVLQARKQRALESIRELDMDFAMGKLSEDDYRGARASYLADAVDATRQIADPHEEGSVDVVSISDGLERQVANRKAALALRTCPGCSHDRAPHDTFCRHCGTRLAQAEGA